MHVCFKGGPGFWENVIRCAEEARDGGTAEIRGGKEGMSASTKTLVVRFLSASDPHPEAEADGFAISIFHDEGDVVGDWSPWLAWCERPDAAED